MKKIKTESIGAMDAPAHILFMIDQLCEAGGAERVLLNTIRWLPKERFRCSLITFKLDTSLELFRRLPCPHFVYPLRRTYDWNAFRTLSKIREFLLTENVRIVHTFHETADLWGGLVSKIGANRILVSSRRDMGILRRFKHDIAYRMLNPMFDLVLAVSEEVRRFCVQKDHLAPRRVATLYNGLELGVTSRNGADSLRTLLSLNSSTAVIATVGNIRRVKGIDILVETAAIVARQKPNVLFLVIGASSDLEYLRQLKARITDLGVSANVRFWGETTDVAALLRSCDLFFLPSRSEGFSNALIEAMAWSLPCVATNVGGNAEAVADGESGYIIESEDAAGAANRILAVLESRDLARSMGAAGRKIVENRFTAEIMIKQLVGHYERLLADRRN
jgi:glycosyltransferase involved in cell wall biosynthesis